MRTYLIFTLHGCRYGLDAGAVREIFLLPELVRVAEAPGYIAGLLNLRGEILPVIDLAARLGLPRHRPRRQDSVIVASFDGASFGLIVDMVHEVRGLEAGAIDPVPSYGGGVERESRFITSLARVDDSIVAVLGLDRIIGLADGLGEIAEAGEDGLLLFAPESGEEEREIFRERARTLRAPLASPAPEGLRPMALFALGGEHFGMSLDLVREFAEIREVTPVPCSPEHIVGQTNLRGDILTLVDIRGVLGLAMVRGGNSGRAIVIQFEDIRAGIIADEVIDVVDLLPENITLPPVALRGPGESYITGVTHYGGRIFTILDLAGIIAGGGLEVDEQVG